MKIIYYYLIPLIWVIYIVYWWLKAKEVKQDKQKESMSSRFIRLLTFICVFVLLVIRSIRLGFLDERFIPEVAGFWTGALITACGLSFSVWARNHLGSNWSQSVSVKKDHELITSGPYRIVRHPIYTGLLFAITGSAVAFGEWRGVLAVSMTFAILWYKLKLEEKWMGEQFGEQYKLYSKQVAGLVPFIF